MGKYATTTSISVRLPGFLIDDTTTSDTTGTQTFSEFIDKAETMFDSSVARKYNLPFTVVPPLARELSFGMATWYTIRAFSTRDWPNRNEMLDDYEKSFETLGKVVEGEIRLTLTDGSEIVPSEDLLQSNREGQSSIFNIDNQTKWKPDEQRLDEIDALRD